MRGGGVGLVGWECAICEVFSGDWRIVSSIWKLMVNLVSSKSFRYKYYTALSNFLILLISSYHWCRCQRRSPGVSPLLTLTPHPLPSLTPHHLPTLPQQLLALTRYLLSSSHNLSSADFHTLSSAHTASPAARRNTSYSAISHTSSAANA